MSLYDTLNTWGCTSWYQLHNNAKDQITQNLKSINGSLIQYKLQDGNIAGYFTGSTYITDYEIKEFISSDGFTLESSDLQSLSPEIGMFNLQSFTLSIWVMQTTTAVTGTVSTIYDNSNSNETIYTRLQINSSNVLSFICNNGSSTITVSCPTILTNNVWYHIIITHTINEIILYINGINVATGGAITLDFTNQIYDAIGAYAYDYTNTFTGCLKNLMIFNTILTTTQIKKLYYLTYIK